MDQSLVDSMRTYLSAGAAMDLDAMDEIYDDEFENVRVDLAGRTVMLTKGMFMQRFRVMREQGETLEAADDATFLATTVYGDFGQIVMRRVKGGEPVLYTFVWRMRDGKAVTMLREFTFDRDLSYLLQLMNR
jgi:hypothetical protein